MGDIVAETAVNGSNGEKIQDEKAVDISSQYETPTPEPIGSFTALKERIKKHYELASDYYYSLWYATPIIPFWKTQAYKQG